jgi:hypothetical protein
MSTKFENIAFLVDKTYHSLPKTKHAALRFDHLMLPDQTQHYVSAFAGVFF